MICGVEGCNGKTVGRGLCRKHYTRLLRYGNVFTVNSPKGTAGPRKCKPIEYLVNQNNCFVCTSHHKDKDGYPRLKNGKNISRFIYEQCFGEIPSGLLIRHKCDNPQCINPEHLETGTALQNYNDMVQRGRRKTCPGELNGQSKLDSQQVAVIRRMLNTGFTQKQIGEMFGVSRRLIGKIKAGLLWKGVG